MLLPCTAAAMLRWRIRLASSAGRESLIAFLIVGLIALFIVYGVAHSPPRPVRFASPGQPMVSVLIFVCGLFGFRSGMFSAKKSEQRISESWLGWMLTRQQAFAERALGYAISVVLMGAGVSFIALLTQGASIIQPQLTVHLALSIFLGFLIGLMFSSTRIVRIVNLSRFVTRLLSRAPFAAAQIINPLRFLIFALPAMALSWFVAIALVVQMRLEMYLTGLVLTAILATMPLAELRPATPALKPMLAWSGQACFWRLLSCLGYVHSVVLLSLCSPLLVVGFIGWPYWSMFVMLVLVFAAWYAALIRNIAAFKSILQSHSFLFGHLALATVLLIGFPVTWMIAFFHIRWLVRHGQKLWLA